MYTDYLSSIGNTSIVFTMAVSCSLADANLLTQRTVLEVLVNRFEFHKNILSDEELDAVMESLLSVMLKKDMSLNRRVYLWLLGNDSIIQFFTASNCKMYVY
jgi:hypothetical protein